MSRAVSEMLEYSTPGSAVAPQITEKRDEQQQIPYNLLTGFYRISVQQLLQHAEEIDTTVEVNVDTFGINEFAGELSPAKPAPQDNYLMQAEMNRICEEAADTAIRAALEQLSPLLREFNRDSNESSVRYYPASKVLVLTARHTGYTRNAIPASLLRSMLQVSGIASITVKRRTGGSGVVIEVSVVVFKVRR